MMWTSWLRSALYFLFLVPITPFYTLLLFVFLPCSARTRHRVVMGWVRMTNWAVRNILGIRVRLIGEQNIPAEPAVVLSRHESGWETLALQEIFVPLLFVMKRELYRIPFFGWGLACLPMISIDRSAGKDALMQVVDQGGQRLKDGYWVLVFPEGTRLAPGQMRRFKAGGALLAVKTGVPVVPVALNSGDVWRRNAFLKFPGTVTVSIGPVIHTQGLTAEEVNTKAQTWIYAEMQRLRPVANARVAA